MPLHVVSLHAVHADWIFLPATCWLQVYVQDLLRQQGSQLWQLMERCGAVVYVCGDARRMAPGVAAAFQGIAQEWGGRGSSAAAANWLGSMRESRRYLEDVWS